MSLTNPNTPVSQQDLKDFYDKIKPYMGLYPSAMGKKIGKGDIYSTEERLIGQWYDGKPLYQKVINISSSQYTTNTWSNVADLSTLNIDNIIFGGEWTNGIIKLPIPYTDSINHVWIQLVSSDLMANVSVGVDVAGSLNIILQYTKTTDSAISIGDETDYSTTEKIVGTWIGGKPLYQKTISDNTTDINTDNFTSLTQGIASIDRILDAKVYVGTGTLLPCLVRVNNSNIEIKASGGIAGNARIKEITLQYTKTT